ncbi:MAG: hypothetical protein UU34_C0002G0052 [Candidatus Curtissbacteria bacterium GW2011_GWA1_41_11]|uniref:O-antigen ligase-related domain-containing protein n=1 Tax=Candidatus Curtissbacteria bacterium GW2011_GWA1_41_11 TaxID=1618409 RepID=A0A0G0WU12_9BACT|nr:MAG: hypothetical protein UU34_C0002G0052 [Candidatus Curtissbacteria bacterium GW2011_GWA1_41_11]
MNDKLLPLLNKSIFIVFVTLAVATPFIFSTFNTELYEVPKMHFVYLTAVVIFFLTLAKFILPGKITIPKNPILIIFAAFVLVQLVSTFFSMDKFTSIFGFPSRLNGGLISQLAYLIIFTGFLVNLNFEKAKKILIAIVISALAVSFWGIPAHFDKDPSCLVLVGKLTSSCWKQDFNPTLRIFSTLGQPNWLASYLVLILPISITFLLKLKNKKSRIFFFISTSLIFWAIILTNSRAGVLGLVVSLAVFAILLGIKNLKENLKTILSLAIIFATITLFFGTTLTTRTQEAITNNQPSALSVQPSAISNKPTQTALTIEGTESGRIRLIVWQGAINIFKHSPILGTGPETFVSSYFMFRPASHNQTSEWEFFYNKAHNEFLNYLANTGAVGFIAYALFLIASLVSIFKLQKNSLIAKAIFAALIGYLTTIFFGFSTVATQVTFFTLVASAILLAKNQQTLEIDIHLKENFKFPAILTVALISLFISSFVLRSYLSNVFEKRAEGQTDNSFQKELTAYTNSIRAFPYPNPYLLASYSSSMALASVSVEDENQKDELATRSNQLAQKALTLSPNNFLIAQRVAKTYALLVPVDDNYKDEAQNITEKLIKLAPNYPTTYLTNAKIYVILEDNEMAASSVNKALQLKPDYLEAQQLLDQINAEILQ